MKKLMGIILMVLMIMLASPLHLGNAYLRTSRFDVVKVERGESVWTIAEKYAKDSSEVSEMAVAIIEVNGLDNEGSIKAGQKIRIPIISRK